MKRVIQLLALTCLVLWVATQPVLTQGNAANRGATTNDWQAYGGTTLSWRYSALNQVNASNVTKLAPAWIFQSGDYADGMQSTPVVVDGVLFISTARSFVFAIDGATGKVLWEYKYQAAPGNTIALKTRGVGVGDGKVFLGTRDNYVVALDQKTGKEVWKVANADASTCRCGINGAPMVIKDKVIIGAIGPRGNITAYDTKTGHMAWRFYVVPGPGEKGNETWEGDSWKYGAGAVWTAGSYDPDLDVLYFGVGDPRPAFYSDNRKGRNLYTCAVVALDLKTGALKWYYQEIPNDVWDWDVDAEFQLLDREVDGRMRKLLVHMNKGGYAFVLDRTNGELIRTYPFAENINWVKSIDAKGDLVGRVDPVFGPPNTFICPSNLGAKSWNQTAFSPRTGLLYAPIQEMCNDIQLRKPTSEGDRGGGTWIMRPPPGKDTGYSHLDAIDPVTGKRAWTYPYKYSLLASVLATAGDLVFSGDDEGFYFALDAKTGRKLWSFQTGASHRGGSVTYMVGGRQYIATPTGRAATASDISMVLWPEAASFRVASTLVVFALPEGTR